VSDVGAWQVPKRQNPESPRGTRSRSPLWVNHLLTGGSMDAGMAFFRIPSQSVSLQTRKSNICEPRGRQSRDLGVGRIVSLASGHTSSHHAGTRHRVRCRYMIFQPSQINRSRSRYLDVARTRYVQCPTSDLLGAVAPNRNSKENFYANEPASQCAGQKKVVPQRYAGTSVTPLNQNPKRHQKL
jgi:hypothetical protein